MNKFPNMFLYFPINNIYIYIEEYVLFLEPKKKGRNRNKVRRQSPYKQNKIFLALSLLCRL